MYLYSDSTKGFYKRGTHRVIPEDAVEITHDEYQDLQAKGPHEEYTIGSNGKPEKREKPIPPGQARKDRDAIIRRHLEDTAQAQGFESMLDAVSYADEPTDPARQALGSALRAWRSTVMLAVDAAPDNQPGPALINSLPDFT